MPRPSLFVVPEFGSAETAVPTKRFDVVPIQRTLICNFTTAIDR